MKLGKTAISHFASQGLVTLAGFASSWLIAVILGAEGLGKYSIIVSLGFFWLAVPANAISAAVNKRVSEGNSPGEYIGGGVILTLSICIVIITLPLVVGQILASFISDNSELIIVLIDYNVEIAVLLPSTITYRFAIASLQAQKKLPRQDGFLLLNGLTEPSSRLERYCSDLVLWYITRPCDRISDGSSHRIQVKL